MNIVFVVSSITAIFIVDGVYHARFTGLVVRAFQARIVVVMGNLDDGLLLDYDLMGGT